MQSIFNERRVNLSIKSDRIIWCDSQSGKYSVKLGYNLLEAVNDEVFASKDLCWQKEILPKAEAFTWLAYNGRILTAKRRREFGMVGPTRCPCWNYK